MRHAQPWAHAHHFEFLAKRKYLDGNLLPSKYLLDNAREWDNAMDAKGFLRFTTYERTVLHIGNVLDGDITYFPRKEGANVG